jgi:hypothetical protein
MLSRRIFVKKASLVVAAAHVAPWSVASWGAGNTIAETSRGKVRGLLNDTTMEEVLNLT